MGEKLGGRPNVMEQPLSALANTKGGLGYLSIYCLFVVVGVGAHLGENMS